MTETYKADERSQKENSYRDDCFKNVKFLVFFSAFVKQIIQGIDQVNKDDGFEYIKKVGYPNTEVLDVLEEGSGDNQSVNKGDQSDNQYFDNPNAFIYDFHFLRFEEHAKHKYKMHKADSCEDYY